MKSGYSEIELDALRELGNIGSGTAATALSGLLGRTVDVAVPAAMALPLAEAVERVGRPDAEVTAVLLPIVGDIDAQVLVLFEREDALCRLLGTEPGTEVGDSALGEIGNIVGSSYVGALVAMTGLSAEPRPPRLVTDFLGALVSTLLARYAVEAEIALLLDSELVIEGESSGLTFLLVPRAASVDEVLGRLGVAG